MMIPQIFWDTFFQKKLKKEKNPFPFGSRVYKGFQGSGKTLGMVDYAFRLKKDFPNCKIFSNIALAGIDYQLIRNSRDVSLAVNYRNGNDGVLILLDEAHLFFNRKDGISLDVLSAISQQRKNRRRIVFSSQIWEELDLSLRKQVKEVVACSQFFGFFIQKISDGETLTYDKLQGTWVAKPLKLVIMRKARFLGERFETRQEIASNMEYTANVAPASSFVGMMSTPENEGASPRGGRRPGTRH